MGNTLSSDIFGLRVTRVIENSPASKLGLFPYFDYVVDILEKPQNFNLSTDFYKLAIENEEKPLNLVIYNQIRRVKRIVPFIPSRNWPNSDFLLGFKVRYENISKAEENLYRITALKNKKLEICIFPNQDFLVAIDEIIYDDLDDLKLKLASHKRCQVVIYNLDDGEMRKVEVECGDGAGLGFEIATGVLHDLGIILRKKEAKLNKEKVDQIVGDYVNGEIENIVNEPKQVPNNKINFQEDDVKKLEDYTFEAEHETPLDNKELLDSETNGNIEEKKENFDLEEEIQIEMS